MSFLGSIGSALKVAAPIALSTLIPGAGGLIAGGLASKALGGSQGGPPGATGGFAGDYDMASAAGGEGGPDGLLGRAEGWLTGNGGKNALGLAQGVNALLQQRKASGLADQALHSAEDDYRSRAPLRAMGLSGLLASQTGNPYAQAR